MLTTIVHTNATLARFVYGLGLALSVPQRRHVLNVVDALIMTVGTKTLAALNRHIENGTEVSNLADTFRIAPWTAQDILGPLRKQLSVEIAQRAAKLSAKKRYVLVNIDDSLLCKDPDTTHLEGVDWHKDHNANRRGRKGMQNALNYLLCNIVVGAHHFTVDLRPYLRETTVRRINRRRKKKGKPGLHFISKPNLAKRILRDLQPLLPAGVPVYVQFDAWFTSAKLLNYIRRLGWHVIARVNPNRNLDQKGLKDRFAAQKHRPYHRVTVGAADGDQRMFLVRQEEGKLRGVPFQVRVWESKRHHRDKHPAYIICTDTSLSAQEGARRYAKRWTCEVDNWYLKMRLGLGDFRLHSYEAITKYMAVVQLACSYLQCRAASEADRGKTPADVIRRHEEENLACWLDALCKKVLLTRDVDAIVRQYCPAAVPT